MPAGNSSWFPSGDQSSPLVYQGSLVVPADLCGGQQGRAPGGATFVVEVTADSSTPLNVRMHYGTKASTSWSGTAHVTPTPPPPPPSGQVTLCKVAGTNVTVGTVFPFTVTTPSGTSTLQLAAGAAPQGTCTDLTGLPLGQVTIKEGGPTVFDVSAIDVTAGLVSRNLAGNKVVLRLTTAAPSSTVTYTNVRFQCVVGALQTGADGRRYREVSLADPLGIQSVYGDDVVNAVVTIPPFTPGTTSPVVVRIQRDDPSQPGHAAVREVNGIGVTHTCDPGV